jgi:hypothetical protein
MEECRRSSLSEQGNGGMDEERRTQMAMGCRLLM